jgi:SOS response regulatory protein OraA/RecX
LKYTDKAQQTLEELLSPIPFFARPMAKKAMEKEIFAAAQEAGHEVVEEDDVLRGYIVAGTKKDTEKDKMVKFLTSKGYDLSKYQDLLA